MAAGGVNRQKKSTAASGMLRKREHPATVDGSAQGRTFSLSRRGQEKGLMTVAQWVAASTAASGVPLRVTDKSTLRDIAQRIRRAT
jgi:hypothetical protein